jgi:hypothetical protein
VQRELNSGWMMRRHFHDVYPQDVMEMPNEGFFPCCELCGMQCNPSYPTHINTKECRARTGTERRHQRDICLALALRQQFSVHDEVLEGVEVFKYLGRLVSRHNNAVQAVQAQLRQVLGTWARVGNILWVVGQDRNRVVPRVRSRNLGSRKLGVTRTNLTWRGERTRGKE